MMTAFSEIGAVPCAGASRRGGIRNVMGKREFLHLLMAQLQHREPLGPDDPAGLSPFRSLEQMNDHLGWLGVSGANQERLAALGMLGREVTVETDIFRLDGAGAELGYQLDRGAGSVRLQVRARGGRQAAELPGRGLAAGSHFLDWDGRGRSGKPLPPGEYRLTVAVVDAAGQPLTARALVRGRVLGVELDPTGSMLATSAGTFSLAQVASVRERRE